MFFLLIQVSPVGTAYLPVHTIDEERIAVDFVCHVCAGSLRRRRRR